MLRTRERFMVALQAAALAAGNFVGWTTVTKEAKAYCDQFDGSLWHLTDFSGTVTGNPLLTPCFWGSVVFAIAFGWTLWMLTMRDRSVFRRQAVRLWWLLLAGTVFALVNNIPIFYKFYTAPAGSAVGCSEGLITNPFITSCFLGFSAFLAAFIFATVAKKLVSSSDRAV